MTTALRVSSSGRFRAGKSLGFDANGRAACNDLGITNGLNFFGFLSIGFRQQQNKKHKSKKIEMQVKSIYFYQLFTL